MATQFIEALGGNKAVAEALGIAPNVVANWHHRAIPWPRKPALARLAGEKGIPLPADFWEAA